MSTPNAQLPTSKAFTFAALAFLGLASFKFATVSEWAVQFVDVASAAGLTHPTIYGGIDKKRFIIETNGAGVAWLDFDRDGWTDALVLSGTRLAEGERRDATFPSGEAPSNRLYRNRGDGTFVDVTERTGMRRTGWASGVCAGDYDNDGWLDLYLTYYGQNVLYRNERGESFRDVTSTAGLSTSDVRWGSGCTFIDYDRDGRLDLFVSNYLRLDLHAAPEPGKGPNCLWKGVPVNCGPKGLPTDTNRLFHNKGNGVFADVSESSGIARVTGRYPMTAAAVDLNDDGWTDIYVASDSTAAILYRNNKDGTFTDVALETGAAYNEHGSAQAGMGLAVGDVNSDGRLDLLKTHFADDIPALYRGLAGGLFEDIAVSAGLGVQNRHVEWGAGLPDLDNDGRSDILYVTGNVYPEVERALPQYPHRGPRIIFRNVDGGRFEDVSGTSGPGATTVRSSRGAAFGDFDHDGDIDVLVMNMNEPPSLLRNDYRGANGWLAIELEGVKSSRDGLGAIVRVATGDRIQTQAALSQASYYSHNDLRLHFGVGTLDRVDRIEVRWPSGIVDVLRDVKTRQVVKIREGRSS
jgi:enediyne biosynthesis protein E4